MKEEAPSSKKMPRKTRAPPPPAASIAPSTPTKFGANDEILSSLLRLNNFDSNIKDESLDIDLSACVTISGDSAAMLASGNSLSSTDFWRVLDESAQTAQLELTNASDDVQQLNASSCLSEDGQDDNSIVDSLFEVKNCKIPTSKNYITVSGGKYIGGIVIKEEKPEPSFSGTFLRPEAPPPSPSPIKRHLVVKPHQNEQPRNPESYSPKSKIKRNLRNDINAIGQAYHINTTHLDDAAVDNIQIIANNTINNSPPTNHVVVNSNKTISSSSFNIFTLPEHTTASCSNNSTNNNNNNRTNTSSSNNNNMNKTTKISSQTEVSNNKEIGPQETGASVPEPLFKCLDCNGLILQGRGEYATHEAIGHRVHYRCSACDRDFEQEASLKKHVKTHRTTDPRKDAWKKCPDCGKCLKLGSMWMHRKIHSDNKKYGCDICGQKFVQKINLTHHSRIHTAEKPYECPECQKRFQERSHLQRHQKYHAQTRSYRCEKCGKMYKTERCLKVHNLVHLEQRPFACNVCEKSFISNSKLKQHSNIHTGERPFKCNYCPRDFTNFPNWLKHTRRRHKVDHKTGEQLENIPSYCSKKSTKSAKAKATEAANAADVAKTTTANDTNTKAARTNQDAKTPIELSGAIPKVQTATKRKKKSPQPQQSQSTISAPTPSQPQPPPPPLVSLSDDRPLPSITVSTMSGIIKTEITRTTNSCNIMTSIPLSLAQNLNPITTITSALATTKNIRAETCKTAKPKRERKQPSPKQVQKAFPTPALLSSIKREITETEAPLKSNNHTNVSLLADTRYAISNFPDLSITSAEELIMEQALEMEECGLYVAQPSAALHTDNAISSSEATAALHFKIKKEFDPMDLSATRIKEEEYVSLKDMNQRLLCSSLESSPYSSPASIEMSATPTILPTSQTGDTDGSSIQSTPASTTNFHINPFTLNTHSPKIVTSLNNTLTPQSVVELQSMLPQISTTQLVTTQNSNMLPATTQAIINHFYLHPMTAMGMSLLPQQQSSTNQKLPSVDTLLFSAAAAAAATSTHSTSTSGTLTDCSGRYFHGKSIALNAPKSPSTTPMRQPKLS